MSDTTPRLHSLASCYENALTTSVRLETMPRETLPSVEMFRENIKAALRGSLEQGKRLGYTNEANQTAFFAMVAFVDESVLRLQHPGFASWAQRPLQEELFGHARAGEIFFDYLRGLLGREDSEETADALEVYTLCLLLGFKGKYALSVGEGALYGQMRTGGRPTGELDSLVRQMREKIGRIRGQALFLRAEAQPPEVKQTVAGDRWSRGLGIAALCLLLLVLLAYGGFWLVLSAGASRTA